jgi:LacI family transcriptional regulator
LSRVCSKIILNHGRKDSWTRGRLTYPKVAIKGFREKAEFRKGKAMVKLKDIAEKCNTSAATVSKALHDSDELSPETISRIKKIAAQMGYVPNAYAQALKMKRSYSIGVIYYDATYGGLKHEFFSSILNALKVEAESHGYNITFLSKSKQSPMTYLQMACYRNMDAYAQALKMKRSYSIGVIYYDATYGGLKHEFFSSILNALKVEAESHGYNITFLSKSKQSPMTYLQMACYRNMDGVIVVSENFDNPEIIELANSSLPVVTIDYIFNSCSSVLSDNTEGTRKLVEYVTKLGHRKIAYLYGDDTDVTHKRLAGFYTGMKEKDLMVHPSWVLQAQYHSPSKTGRLVKTIMSQSGEKPTCILCPDDISLLGALTALTDLGYNVPNDLSVVGYDGIELSRIYRPVFTTYVQNSDALRHRSCQSPHQPH